MSDEAKQADPHMVMLFRDAEAYRAGDIGESGVAPSRHRALRRAAYALAGVRSGPVWGVAVIGSGDGSWSLVLSVEARQPCAG